MGPLYSSDNGQSRVDYLIYEAKFIAEKNVDINRYIKAWLRSERSDKKKNI